MLFINNYFSVFLVPTAKHRRHAAQKEVVCVSSEQAEEEEEWEEEGGEEEEGCTSSGEEQSEYSDASYYTDDEEKISKQAQPVNVKPPLKNLVIKNIRKRGSNPSLVASTPQIAAPKRRLKRKIAEPQIQAEAQNTPIKRKFHRRPKIAVETSVAVETEVLNPDKQEISGENSELPKDDKKKVPETLFDDSNIDVNMNNTTSQNVVEKKIMPGSNLLIVSKMIEAIGEKGQSYEYAAVSFQRRMKSQKAYTFNIPLSTIGNIIQALEIIRDANQVFLSR